MASSQHSRPWTPDKPPMSRSEAEGVMERARSKDFWIVDYGLDNRERLQEAIDLIYNCMEGNDYEVKYQENQNVTRLIIYCKICSIDVTSFDPFQSHDNGKAHKKLQQRVTKPKDPNLIGGLIFKPLNETKGVFAPDSLEDMIDATKEIVIGVQFVYKEVINAKESFTCQLCQRRENVKQINISKMFEHLKSGVHIRNYLDIKFGLRTKSLAEFMDEARRIEEYEGKIHAPIVEFTDQLEMMRIEKEGRTNYGCIQNRKDSESWERLTPSPELICLTPRSKDFSATFDSPNFTFSDLIKQTKKLFLHLDMVIEKSEIQEVMLLLLLTLTKKLDHFYTERKCIVHVKFDHTTTIVKATESTQKFKDVLNQLVIVNEKKKNNNSTE